MFPDPSSLLRYQRHCALTRMATSRCAQYSGWLNVSLLRTACAVKYRIYIDEVGNPDLESSDNPNHRFLSLTGVILELGYVQRVLHPEMEALKTRHFRSHPDEPVIFHRRELLNAKPPFEALRQPGVRQQFDEELLRLLADWDYTVISVCLDKKKHRETYTSWRYDPYHYCLAVLLERFVFFLGRKEHRGDVMAESRGGKEDRRLKNSFAWLWEHGTDWVDPQQFQGRLTSKQLKVKTKTNNITGLQLADLIAHPSRHEILYENNLVPKPPAPFASRIVDILKAKYDQQAGRVFGKKLLLAHEKGPFGPDGFRHPPPVTRITIIIDYGQRKSTGTAMRPPCGGTPDRVILLACTPGRLVLQAFLTQRTGSYCKRVHRRDDPSDHHEFLTATRTQAFTISAIRSLLTGRMIPRSQMRAVMRRAGVTSKAGL